MKLQLTIGGGTLAGRTFDLENGFLTIGRGETCSVRFDPLSERIASKQHCFIETKADGFYITDNQSTNGTLVNGNVITSVKLNNGDQIQFGRNGVTGTVAIEAAANLTPIPAESFRDMQVQQFNQMVATGPVNITTSFSNIGLGNVQTITPQPSNAGKIVGIIVALLIGFILAGVVGIIMLLSLGVIPAIIATVVAFTPAVIYVTPLIWLDRYDPEPAWLLALAFAWGALVAVVVSFFVNSFVGIVVSLGISPNVGELVMAVISAPIFEEGTKGLGVLLIMVFFHKYFDDILDGIVFAGVVALGFATVENVLYYGRVIGGGAFSDFLIIFAIRGILSPFAHVSFTAMTGIGCGISRESHKKWVKYLFPIFGYFGAVTLHAIWNGFSEVITALIIKFGYSPTCASFGLGGDLIGLCGFFTGYLVLEIPLFFIIFVFTIYVLRRQRRILTEMLAIDIARGLLTQENVDKVTSAIKSTGWLISGLFSGKYVARSHYLRAVGKLGLSYWHIQRATAAHGQTGSFQQNPILREEVLKWRDKV